MVIKLIVLVQIEFDLLLAIQMNRLDFVHRFIRRCVAINFK